MNRYLNFVLIAKSQLVCCNFVIMFTTGRVTVVVFMVSLNDAQYIICIMQLFVCCLQAFSVLS